MRYDVRHFHRPACSYPGCGNEYGDDWWSDAYEGAGEAWNEDWLVLDGRLGDPVCICPEHLLHGADGAPARYGAGRNEPKTAGLLEFYDGGEGEPLPRPECEAGVLDAMLHSELLTASHPFLLPVCEYPHCGTVFHDPLLGVMWLFDEDMAETAVHDSLRWAMLRGDDGEPHAFCPLHVMPDADGRPVRIADTTRAPALAERCADPSLPAVRDDCVDGVLAVLRGETR